MDGVALCFLPSSCTLEGKFLTKRASLSFLCSSEPSWAAADMGEKQEGLLQLSHGCRSWWHTCQLHRGEHGPLQDWYHPSHSTRKGCTSSCPHTQLPPVWHSRWYFGTRQGEKLVKPFNFYGAVNKGKDSEGAGPKMNIALQKINKASYKCKNCYYTVTNTAIYHFKVLSIDSVLYT